MSDDAVQNAVATEAAPQDIQAETTTNASAQNTGENIEGKLTETNKTEDGGMDADKTQDIDVPTGNDVEIAEEKSVNGDDTKLKESNATTVEEETVAIEGEGNTNADATDEDAEKIVSTGATEAEEIAEVKGDAKEENTTDTTNDATEEVKEDVAVEGKDGIEMEVEEELEKKDDVKSESETNVEARKEVAEDVVEETKENIIEEVLENPIEDTIDAAKETPVDKSIDAVNENSTEEAVEGGKENSTEDAIDQVKENSMEDGIEETEDDPMEVEEIKDGVVEEVNTDVVEEVNTDVVEEVNKDVVEEVNKDVVEEVNKDVVEEVNKDVVEEVNKDVVEEVNKDIEEGKEDTVEEDVKDAVEEGKQDGIEDNKVVSMEVDEPAVNEKKEVTVIEIDDSAPEAEDDSKEESSEHEAVATPSKGRGRKAKKVHESPYSLRGATKRERKVADHFEPGNYREDRQKASNVTVQLGKGTKLKDIPSVRAKIDKLAIKDPTLLAAHKFLYGGRGSVARRVIKKQLLDFSGYLIADVKGQEKEEDDDTASEKFAARANRMTIPLLKIMCDLFDVDRSHPGRPSALDKEGIVGRLLDFMVAPDITLTNAGKTKAKKRGRPSISRSPKAKRSKKSEEIEVEVEYIEDEEEEEEEDAPKGAEGKKMPSKKELQKFVRAYVTCFSMEKTTTKHLIQTASDKFDVDVASKRKDILELLTAEMPSE